MIKKYDKFIVEGRKKTIVQYRETLKISEQDKNKLIEYSNDKILPLLDEDGFRCRFKWVQGKVRMSIQGADVYIEVPSAFGVVDTIGKEKIIKTEDIGDILELVIDNDNCFSKEFLVEKLEDLIEYLKDENMVFLKSCSFWGGPKDEYYEGEIGGFKHIGAVITKQINNYITNQYKWICYLYFG